MTDATILMLTIGLYVAAAAGDVFTTWWGLTRLPGRFYERMTTTRWIMGQLGILPGLIAPRVAWLIAALVVSATVPVWGELIAVALLAPAVPLWGGWTISNALLIRRLGGW